MSTEIERAEHRVAQAQRDLEHARIKESERVERRLRAQENARKAGDAAEARASITPRLLVTDGDWCQLERDGKILYNGHYSDLEIEQVFELLGVALDVEHDATMLDDRNFA